jgi:hypothetical protein
MGLLATWFTVDSTNALSWPRSSLVRQLEGPPGRVRGDSHPADQRRPRLPRRSVSGLEPDRRVTTVAASSYRHALVSGPRVAKMLRSKPLADILKPHPGVQSDTVTASDTVVWWNCCSPLRHRAAGGMAV